ncbi:MAG: LTA synthase family protein [Ferruginibacter sp.]
MFNNYAALKQTNGDAYLSLLYGLRMDASMSAYLTLPIGLFVFLSIFLPFFKKYQSYFYFTIILLLPILLILFADAELFKAWGNHIDVTPLKYLSNPKAAWASIAHLPITLIFIGFILLYLLLYFFFKRWIKLGVVVLKTTQQKWLSAITLLILTAAFIIPLRGGLQLSPINQSSVYFSKHSFSNQAAINVVWNFMSSVITNRNDVNNPFKVVSKKEAQQTLDSLFVTSKAKEGIWLKQSGNKKPNVLIIVWESFTAKAVEWKKGSSNITPGFNQLINEGIYFDSIYATGDRTDKGIVGILSGYPAQPTTSIVKEPTKAAKLPMLSKTFKAIKYHTAFFYGGELEFANMKAYLVQGEFDQLISVKDFKDKDLNSKWGAHDGVVADTLQRYLQQTHTPFFTTWLTLSSHEPFEIPTKPLFPGTLDEDAYLSSLHYTDEVVYQFIQQAKQQSWWANTIVVITGDHGHRIPASKHRWEDFRTPLLFLGGALSQTNIRISEVGSQTDIAATLLAQLNIISTPFTWSKNMLASKYKPNAYFSFNNGFGWVVPPQKFIYDNVGLLIVDSIGSVPKNVVFAGRKLQQAAFQDYLDK